MALQKQEQILCKALHTDLGKSKTESVMCEIGLVQGEIHWMKQHLGRLCRQKHVRTPLAQFAAKSYQSPSPYGNVLIMSPWNYPVLLTLEPLVDAIAAGNTAVVKPSAYAPASANVLKDLLEECFPPEYVAVVLGGREENQALLQEKFDKIFFTGSVAVGKQVMESAARSGLRQDALSLESLSTADRTYCVGSRRMGRCGHAGGDFWSHPASIDV